MSIEDSLKRIADTLEKRNELPIHVGVDFGKEVEPTPGKKKRKKKAKKEVVKDAEVVATVEEEPLIIETEDVLGAMRKNVADTNSDETVKALLRDFGAEKFSELKEEDYQGFYEALEEKNNE